MIMKNSMILFYKNNLNIYMVILSDFDNLTLGKIIYFFIKLLWMFYKNLWLHIEHLGGLDHGHFKTILIFLTWRALYRDIFLS